MGETTVSKTTGKATIDAAMIVIRTKTTNKTYDITSGSKVAVEAAIDTQEAITLTIKGVLKAKKPEKKTLTGNTITITDALTIYELLPLLNGGEPVLDTDGKTIKGFHPPKVGEEVKMEKFDLDVYTAIMEGSTIVGYEKTTYPSCVGQPLGLNTEDDVFRTNEYNITSTPGAGERAYNMEIVDSLPTFAAAGA